jgi:hypothetical protein
VSIQSIAPIATLEWWPSQINTAGVMDNRARAHAL